MAQQLTPRDIELENRASGGSYHLANVHDVVHRSSTNVSTGLGRDSRGSRPHQPLDDRAHPGPQRVKSSGELRSSNSKSEAQNKCGSFTRRDE